MDISITSENQIHHPTRIAMYLYWYRENRRAIFELIVLLFAGFITFIILVATDFAEMFFEYSRQHEAYELDEIVLATLTVFALYLPIFTVSRWMESNARLRLANTDSLTEFYNRRRGWEILQTEMARAARYSRPLTIIIFDIDHFKKINDKNGHLMGDEVLRRVTKAVQKATRSVDALIRWGGEEFMIICAESNRDAGFIVAERLRRDIEGLKIPDGIQVTASFGIAAFESTDTLKTFVKRADGNLYQAKETGRNKVIG